MSFRYSLRRRIIIAFCSFGTVLGIVYASIVYISLDALDDHLIDTRLNEEIEYVDAHYLNYNIYPQPTSPYLTLFVGTEDIPLNLLNAIDGFFEGFHEVYIDEDEYHIAIQKLPGQEKLLKHL